ncbi:MAG: tRNA preQ1(34) S-adenosylmethionine ribosyltransferase-isomerase QueA [Desulfuromonadales bacterium]|nr:tRNA preQ1(34) S-adenosylmethionine ribosyltransferase-isomerase QueA [Desulfuromonadales bacterium]
MRLSDFDYLLPPELIAQHPAATREASRLMHVDSRLAKISTGRFRDIADYFSAGDLLVINDTRVRPARLLGHKESGGQVELLLLRRLAGIAEDWFCLRRSSRPLRVGGRLNFPGGLTAQVLEGEAQEHIRVRFNYEGDFEALLDQVGHLPLPPYIRRADTLADRERYQTVFARHPGALAAPTAGLHFTEEIFAQLRGQGVEIVSLTLHVGLGTFLPVRVDTIREHRMHAETYDIPPGTAQAVNRAKAEGRRVIALGTTAARTLETAVNDQGHLMADCGESEIFIYPGFRFRMLDGLVTNFHLPKSTLLMLVSALAGRELILKAYRRAIDMGFRFFSYGDCMLILPSADESRF